MRPEGGLHSAQRRALHLTRSLSFQIYEYYKLRTVVKHPARAGEDDRRGSGQTFVSAFGRTRRASWHSLSCRCLHALYYPKYNVIVETSILGLVQYDDESPSQLNLSM